MRNTTLFLVSLVAVVSSTAIPGDAAQVTISNSVSYTGNTFGQPTFYRPGLAATEPPVPYVSQVLSYTSIGFYSFYIRPIPISLPYNNLRFDSIVAYLYDGGFDPQQPSQRLLLGWTPYPPLGMIPPNTGMTNFGSLLLYGGLNRYTLVVTGQSSRDVGIFGVTVGGNSIALGASSQLDPGVPFQFSPLLGLLLCVGGWWLQQWWQSRKA